MALSEEKSDLDINKATFIYTHLHSLLSENNSHNKLEIGVLNGNDNSLK